jgi:hypothetical protein
LTNPNLIETIKEHYHEKVVDFIRRLLYVDDVHGTDFAGSVIYRLFLKASHKITDTVDWSYVTDMLVDTVMDETIDEEARWGMFSFVQQVAPQSKYKEICKRVSTILKDPEVIWVNPDLVAEAVYTLCLFNGVEYLDMIRNAYDKNCVHLDLMGGYCAALKMLKQPIDQKDPVVQKYYKEDCERVFKNKIKD